MLEILLLFFLCRYMGNIARQKNLSPGRWKWLTILYWIGFEFLGVIIGIWLFGFDKNNLSGLMLFAVACGFGGFLLVKAKLENKVVE